MTNMRFILPVVVAISLSTYLHLASAEVHAWIRSLEELAGRAQSGAEIPVWTEDDCEGELLNLTIDWYDEGNHSCSCSSSTASCISVFPETCGTLNCSEVECVNSTATSVFACIQREARIDYELDVNRTAVEVARTFTTYFSKGVENICMREDSVDYSGVDVGEEPSDCSVKWDGVACTSCTICDDGNTTDGKITRSIDCSNINPDAVNSKCIPGESDAVDSNVLKFSANAVCTLVSTSGSHFTPLGLLTSMASLITILFW